MNLNLNFNATHGNLSRALADSLKSALARQRLPVGERMPSNREIAERAGVSQVTARMAVARLCREGVLETRAGVGTFVAAEPGMLTIPQRPGFTRIGVVLSPWDSREAAAWDHQAMLGDILGALNSEARQLLIFSYAQWLEYAERDPELLITENALDTLLWFYNGPRETAFIVQLEQQKFRQLIFNRRQPGVKVPAILHDDAGMIDDIVAHLDDEELNRTLVFLGDPIYSPYLERKTALFRAFRRRKLEFRQEQMVQLPEAPFPNWVSRTLPRELEFAKPLAVLDLVGCINLWKEFSSQPNRNFKLISTCPLDEPNEIPGFHYTFYQQLHSYVVPKLLRDFFAGRNMPGPLYLPFRRHEKII